MNRLFGKGKPKEPAPNLGDCVANVDSRAESVDKKVAPRGRLDLSDVTKKGKPRIQKNLKPAARPKSAPWKASGS